MFVIGCGMCLITVIGHCYVLLVLCVCLDWFCLELVGMPRAFCLLVCGCMFWGVGCSGEVVVVWDFGFWSRVIWVLTLIVLLF